MNAPLPADPLLAALIRDCDRVENDTPPMHNIILRTVDVRLLVARIEQAELAARTNAEGWQEALKALHKANEATNHWFEHRSSR